jgi:hypothetical protein
MRHTPRCSLLILAASLALPVAADAAALVVTNPGFEATPAANGMFNGTNTTGPAGWGWTVANTGPTNDNRFFGVWNPTGTPSYIPARPAGENIGVIFLDDVLGLEARLQQVLAATLELSTEYTLTVEVGNFRPSPGGDPWNFAGFPGYRVDLLAGATVLASDNNTLAPGEGIFLTSTVSFTTGASHPAAGQPLSIRLVNLNGPGAGVEVNFDNVSLNAEAVPEPSGLALLAVGTLIGLRGRRRRD